ncbi:MAG: SPOR domain-containing protein [Gemmatimonadales bacterium]
MPLRTTFPILLATLVACGSGDASNPVKDAFLEAPQEGELGAPVAFRFPVRGGNDTKLYRLPDFEEVSWRFEASRSPAARVVGFAGDQDLIYLLSESGALVALDLTSGRTRIVDTTVALAAMSPIGVPVLVRENGTVASVAYRTAVPWSTEFATLPQEIWVGARQRLIALVQGEDRTLELHADGQSTITQSVPDGRLSVSRWGDVAAVATDSGVAFIDPSDPGAQQFLRLPDAPQFAVFSPSGHRLYVGSDGGALYDVDRFTQTVLDSLSLPGAAISASADPWGRVLLLQPAVEDGVWIVDLAAWTLKGTVEGEWDAGLPLVGPDGSILVRRGDQVVSLSSDSLQIEGAITDPRRDRWMVAAWDPRRPALESAAQGERETQQTGQIIYVQVSSTSNPDWASDLAQNLDRAGMQASVLPPEREDDPYRVVLGPYPSREAAEATRRRLNMPSWIFIQDTTQGRQ